MSTEAHPPLELDQFTLWRATFEARTAPNYLQWDRSGSMCAAILKKIPKIEFTSAAPDNISFSQEHRSYGVVLKPAEDHTSIAISEQRPHPSLKAMAEAVEEFLEISARMLEIDEFSRIGLRLMFTKEYKDLNAATSALLGTGLLNYPRGPHFGIEGTPANPSYILKWEDGKKGVMVHLTAETRKLEFSPLADFEVEGFKKEISRILFDFDYYTMARVGLSQLRPTDWIHNALHLTRRDSGKFLRGL